MELTLKNVTKRLAELIEELPKAGKEYSEATYRVEKRKAELYTQDSTIGLSNQSLRDAYVSQVLEQEGLLEPKQKLSYEFKKLMNEKDMLIEISRNLREIEKPIPVMQMPKDFLGGMKK